MNDIKYPILQEIKEGYTIFYYIETPFGVCKQRKCNYNKGCTPTIFIAVNKSEYFKSMCYAKFGDNNDDLSNIHYINNKTKVLIICNITNKEYWITPDSYLAGHRSIHAQGLSISKRLKSNKDDVFTKIKKITP